MFNRIKNALPSFAKCSAIPASWMEKIYLTEPHSLVGKAAKVIGLRAVYGLCFLPAVGIDLVSSATAGLRNAAGVFLYSDDLQDRRIQAFKKYGSLFSKNALALFFSPFGLMDPKLVELHFASEKPNQGIRSGGGLYHSDKVEIRYPESIEDVIDIVNDATRQGKKIMPIGAGRSQGKQFIPEGPADESGIAIDLSKLNTVEINANEKTATVGAGTRWYEIQNEADKHKLALKVMQASNVFSVGGSIGTNIHGWDHQTGMVSNTIISMEIINAQGERQTLTPNDSLFHHITGGLGLFGIVVSVKIKLTDNELLKEVGVEMKLGDYINHFHENVKNNDDIRMHLYRLSLEPDNLLGSGVAVDYVRTGKPKIVTTPGLTQESTYGTRANQVLVNFARRFSWTRKQYWDMEHKRLLANNSPLLTSNAIMQPPINAMFHEANSEAEWLQEYFLPEENLQVFLHDLGRLLMENNVALINASVRFVKQNSKAPMSYAHDGDRFAVVLCFNQSLQPSKVVRASKWLRQAQWLAVSHGGTYYLPYQHVSHTEDFNNAYPHAAEAMRMKLEVDPNELFVSGLYQKYLAPLARPAATKPNYFQEIIKTDEIKKRFSGFLSVVLQRVEAKQLFELLEDVMKYKDTHEEIYAELCDRLAEITPSALADFRLILQSLSYIKNDLTNQATTLLQGRTKINGLVEIGYPGRFVDGFKKHYQVTGNITAVYEGKALSDYVQTGFPRPYHKFAKLDYLDPHLHSVATNSADVVTCYIGLHHFPQHKVQFFLREIKRVLRPDGQFLLVDHDVRNAEDMAMAQGAHIIFNAVTGVSIAEEMKEIRLFNSMEYWKEQLKTAGLAYDVKGPDIEMIRDGDPSRNRMVCFKKPIVELVHTQKAESGLDWRHRQKACVSSVPQTLFMNSAPTDNVAVEEFKYQNKI